jgi:hypothetical protein
MTSVPHPDAPTDDEGHPVHPERGHRICAGVKSDRTTPTDHGRERDDIAYCLRRAGWGRDANVGPCSHHRAQWGYTGPDNGQYDHGGFVENLEADLTEQETGAVDDLTETLADPDAALKTIRRQAAEAYIKYKRSGDERFLREYRQLLSEFNIVDAPDQVEVEHSGRVDSDRELTLDETTREAFRKVLRQRRERDT